MAMGHHITPFRPNGTGSVAKGPGRSERVVSNTQSKHSITDRGIHGRQDSGIFYMLRIRVPLLKMQNRFPDVSSWLNYREIRESLLSRKHTHTPP